MKKFSEKVNTLRIIAGLSDRELAGKIGVSPSALGNILRRGAKPRPGVIKKIAGFFDVEVKDLLDDNKPCHPRAFKNQLNEVRETSDEAMRRQSPLRHALMTAQVLREARCRVVGRYLELIQEELALMYAEFQADAEKIKALAARMASTPGKPGKPQPAARSATDQQEQKNKGKQ